MNQPEFDRYSPSYEELLKDPLRDRFTGGESVFFQERKRDLIRNYFRAAKRDTHEMGYLDIGCGKGELISLLRDDFGRTVGCDPSRGMLSSVEGIETKVQEDPARVPFEDQEFDFVTAVCVYHHVPVPERLALAREMARVLKPGGVFVMIEHNPFNPVTRRIVSRTPVDADAVLLEAAEARELMSQAGFAPQPPHYFLYFPGAIYRRGAHVLEEFLRFLPLGGQYAVFATKTEGSDR